MSISVLEKHREDGPLIFFIEVWTEELQPGEYFFYLFAEEMETKSTSRVNTFFEVR